MNIQLYEDNAGGLHLHVEHSSYAWGNVEPVPWAFSYDAEGVALGLTQDWTAERVTVDDPLELGELIAEYHVETTDVTLRGWPGAAGMAYLGLEEEDEQTMKLYKLTPRNDLVDYDPWEPWYDKVFGFVCRAETEQDARILASKESGDEGEEAWLDSEYSVCEELSYEGDPGIILTDLRSA